MTTRTYPSPEAFKQALEQRLLAPAGHALALSVVGRGRERRPRRALTMDRARPHRPLWVALPLALALAAARCATTTAPVAAPSAAPLAATPDAGGPRARDASTTPNAPVRVARAPTPLEREVIAGLGVFTRVCSPCHEAMWRLPPGGRLHGLRWTEAAIRRQIRAGSGRSSGSAMPALDTGRLPEDEMPALLVYLRSINAVTSP